MAHLRRRRRLARHVFWQCGCRRCWAAHMLPAPGATASALQASFCGDFLRQNSFADVGDVWLLRALETCNGRFLPHVDRSSHRGARLGASLPRALGVHETRSLTLQMSHLPFILIVLLEGLLQPSRGKKQAGTVRIRRGLSSKRMRCSLLWHAPSDCTFAISNYSAHTN